MKKVHDYFAKFGLNEVNLRLKDRKGHSKQQIKAAMCVVYERRSEIKPINLATAVWAACETREANKLLEQVHEIDDANNRFDNLMKERKHSDYWWLFVWFVSMFLIWGLSQ